MYEPLKESQYNSDLLLEEELLKLLDLEINILYNRILDSKSQYKLTNLQEALSKLKNLKRVLLASNSIIPFKDFEKFTNFIIETMELSLNNNQNMFDFLSNKF